MGLRRKLLLWRESWTSLFSFTVSLGLNIRIPGSRGECYKVRKLAALHDANPTKNSPHHEPQPAAQQQSSTQDYFFSMPAPTRALQSLILCGPGVNLSTFTSRPSELPKSLLPICNRPMIWYPLTHSHRMGITEIALLTPPEAAPALEHALATHPLLTSIARNVKILTPKDTDLTTGTVELLSSPEVQDWVTGDFIVLPCDFVAETDIGPRVVEEWFRKGREGGWGVYYPAGKGEERDYLVTELGMRRKDASLETILDVLPKDELEDLIEEDAHEEIEVGGLDVPRGRVRVSHRDAGVYLLPHWVMRVIGEGRFASLGEDLIGGWADARTDEQAAGEGGFEQPVPYLGAYVHEGKSLVRRVDTTAQLVDVSLYIAKQGREHPLAHQDQIQQTATVGSQSRISTEDSVVGHYVTVGERCVVKGSVIGANCNVGSYAKLQNCVLMDNVDVGEGAVLTNCVVGKWAKVESGKSKPTRLTDCEVAPAFVVAAGSDIKGETLTPLDTLMDLDDEEGEDWL
ncbi:hypothetical protein K470DRAFT_215740 [Piedraia hortae CBS 480.64]|uniref:Translation initiation factor eIF2B subunit gamma n=1 Tax=Piedraia hortae CBS 480.64 TaxID=1314780 RepID=A0A6A7C1D4_9PEZI|nr:hypothetical protein K470DRAFT_215740 [Piedraia hortae CBS 480.64]